MIQNHRAETGSHALVVAAKVARAGDVDLGEVLEVAVLAEEQRELDFLAPFG